ncbi:TPA: thr operon leader peptide [Yersinia enterocolitica]|nr:MULTISPECIES: thr operon leader peptide [Yersinia]OVZ92276.1 thr operon leader peptide [Yersinia frederiksenii]OVZ95425.1 thr operon leader peptide [Yersinia frederiksenii]OWF68036.1 thr operon leader peptide [Yersinia frederiksenii]OWF75977.1 thr operon leader peptide [Yersinia frederiksenii]
MRQTDDMRYISLNTTIITTTETTGYGAG